MEINTKPVRLKQETREVLVQVRDFPEATPLYGLSAEEADRTLRSLYELMLDGAALPLVVLNGLRWYCRELARVFRTKRGFPLAFQLELVLRKWVALGSESELLQQLLCSIWEQLAEGGSSGDGVSNCRPAEGGKHSMIEDECRTTSEGPQGSSGDRNPERGTRSAQNGDTIRVSEDRKPVMSPTCASCPASASRA